MKINAHKLFFRGAQALLPFAALLPSCKTPDLTAYRPEWEVKTTVASADMPIGVSLEKVDELPLPEDASALNMIEGPTADGSLDLNAGTPDLAAPATNTLIGQQGEPPMPLPVTGEPAHSVLDIQPATLPAAAPEYENLSGSTPGGIASRLPNTSIKAPPVDLNAVGSAVNTNVPTQDFNNSLITRENNAVPAETARPLPIGPIGQVPALAPVPKVDVKTGTKPKIVAMQPKPIAPTAKATIVAPSVPSVPAPITDAAPKNVSETTLANKAESISASKDSDLEDILRLARKVEQASRKK